MHPQSLAKGLFSLGVLFIVLGIVAYLWPKDSSLGRLPGDILIQKSNFTFYFPIGTCLLVSLIATLVFRFFKK